MHFLRKNQFPLLHITVNYVSNLKTQKAYEAFVIPGINDGETLEHH